MPSAISRIVKNARSRRLSGQQRPLVNAVPIGIAGAVKSGSNITITFDQAILLNGKPGLAVIGASVSLVSVAQSGPSAVVATFSAAVTAATSLVIPFEDPAIRNASGGYIRNSTFPLS